MKKQASKRHKHTCMQCKSDFTSSIAISKYCSSSCSVNARRKRVEVECAFCKAAIEVMQCKIRMHKKFYCDKTCKAENQRLMVGSAHHNYNRVEYSCDGCNKLIDVVPNRIERQKYIFCSKGCFKSNVGKFYLGENNGNYIKSISKICPECARDFERKPGQFEHNVSYCSRECYFTSRRKLDLKIDRVQLTCPCCKQLFKRLPSQIKGKKNIYCSKQCKNVDHGKIYFGSSHPRFNAELTDDERVDRRKSNEYYIWREKVYARDNYTCQCCKDNKGKNLNAHHKYSYRDNEDLRTVLSNGVTLCKRCHSKFHDIYGYGNNTKEQFDVFLKVYGN
ncbi:HNH endonuclease signature motif containing protein [uncultured Shewanella sp.]|uniref:HNH endonuclease n=1 Tax=uncultured Shewanella sp. TaxID=173975 RepID=UPI002610AE1C|nr:HNH endonuclease signature motif containing protein [uncultured Shewanella sp.]